ncbi:MAG: hypothetical protein WC491_02335 [Candidatus Omnitrophota bacterium]
MIRIELSWAVALYITFTAVGFIVYWLMFDRTKNLPNRSLSERSVWQCSICTQYYIDSKNSQISTCPRCGSYNKKQSNLPQKGVSR